MCRFFLLYKPELFETWADLAMKGYKQYCKTGVLSAGFIEITDTELLRKRYMPPLDCNKKHPFHRKDSNMIFYHIRIPFDKKPESVSLEKVHPYILEERFVAMHNGLIHFKNPKKSKLTDSEQFFKRWIHHYKKTSDLESAFYKATEETLPNSSMNIILYDLLEKKVYVHRSTVTEYLVPPMWMSPAGFANVRIPGGKTLPRGKLLVFPAVA